MVFVKVQGVDIKTEKRFFEDYIQKIRSKGSFRFDWLKRLEIF